MTHAVVWIDHQEARIFHVHPEMADESRILSPQHHVHRHPKGRGEPREHPDDARRFFEDVARSSMASTSVLIVGPASAKHEFMKFVHCRNAHFLSPRSWESRRRIIRPGRARLSLTSSYFKASDRMGGFAKERQPG